jgi:hypothetical protein
MSPPPLLLAAAALFWGWQSEQWAVAIAAAALMETPRYFPGTRFALEAKEFNRIADFCVVLIAVLGVVLYLSFGNPRAVTLLFQWLPFALLPLALAHAWSTSSALDLSVLFWSLRRAPPRRPAKFDPGYPYLATWMLAASAANLRGEAFFVAVFALLAWTLVRIRPKSFRLATWAVLLAACGALGYAGHTGLHRLQLWLESAAPEWLAGGGGRTDPYRSTTDIGSIGELKLSDRIVLRVKSLEGAAKPIGDPPKPPLLLHRASYDDYAAGTWIARNGGFAQLAPDAAGSVWTLQAGVASGRIAIDDYSAGGDPVLSLPSGTARIEALPAIGMKRNPLGAVQVEFPPGYLSYQAVIGEEVRDAAEPGGNDLRIPGSEREAIERVAQELRLTGQAPQRSRQAVQDYFASGFSYALYRTPVAHGRTPLAEFLLESHAGHCEYFASATVLLLRAAGVPARYATGYSVQEYSKLEDSYLVRERHAHSWARAWLDGRWQDIDTTPPTWAFVEAERASFWAPLADLAAWARFRTARWFASKSGEQMLRLALGPAALILAFIVWRNFRAKRRKPEDATLSTQGHREQRGMDSEFFAVQERLAVLGRPRQSSQSLAAWLAGLGDAGLDLETLSTLARLHIRYRFDPQGLDAREREALRGGALDWLGRHSA